MRAARAAKSPAPFLAKDFQMISDCLEQSATEYNALDYAGSLIPMLMESIMMLVSTMPDSPAVSLALWLLTKSGAPTTDIERLRTWAERNDSEIVKAFSGSALATCPSTPKVESPGAGEAHEPASRQPLVVCQRNNFTSESSNSTHFSHVSSQEDQSPRAVVATGDLSAPVARHNHRVSAPDVVNAQAVMSPDRRNSTPSAPIKDRDAAFRGFSIRHVASERTQRIESSSPFDSEAPSSPMSPGARSSPGERTIRAGGSFGDADNMDPQSLEAKMLRWQERRNLKKAKRRESACKPPRSNLTSDPGSSVASGSSRFDCNSGRRIQTKDTLAGRPPPAIAQRSPTGDDSESLVSFELERRSWD